MRTRAFVVLLVLGLLAAGEAWAQEASNARGRVTGRIITADTEEPLQGATVTARNPADSSLVSGTVTDSTGAFVLDGLSIDTYTLRVSFVGFATKRLTDVRLTRARSARELGTITLAQQTAQMDEVTVSAERPAVDIQTDRTVYNTDTQLVTAGGSARTVLQDLPSVQVDIDGSISYRGNEGVVVHINGEPTSLSGQSLASFLQSLPASSVESVEVIPNPSAKYEPEGAAGIINIILKENRAAGWSGGITAGGGTNESYSISGNVGYQSGAWRVFSNYGFRGGSEEEGGSRFRRNLTQNPTVLLDQSSTERETDRGHTLNTQAEYQPTQATSLSFETVLSTDSEGEDGRTNYIRETTSGDLLDRYARLIDNDSGEESIDGRLSLNHEFDPDDHDIEAELRYESEWEDEEGFYTERVLMADGALGELQEREREMMSEREQEATAEIDYVRPLGRFELEAGYQGEWSMESNEQTLSVFDERAGGFTGGETSAFDYEELTHSAYGLLTTPLGAGFEVKAGARMEQALTTFALPSASESFDNNYFSIFPSAFLTFKPNESYQARLSYSKRVRRPNSWQLNPLDDNEDPTFRYIGNPQLNPEYVHSFELSLTRKWAPATLSVSPFFRRTVDEIERRETLRSDGVTVLTFDNFASSNSYGVEVVTSLDLQDWVRGNVTLNAHRVVTDASNVDTDLSNDAMAYSTRANLTFNVMPGLDMQISQYYRAPMDIAGGRIGERFSSDIALRQELFDGKGSVSLRASDVFDTMNFDIQRNTDQFYTESSRNWNQRQLMVTFSYTFGSQDQGGGSRRGGRGDYR